MLSIFRFSSSPPSPSAIAVAYPILTNRSLFFSLNCMSPSLSLPTLVVSLGWDRLVVALPYGPRFRKHRKFIQDGLIPTTMGYGSARLDSSASLNHSIGSWSTSPGQVLNYQQSDANTFCSQKFVALCKRELTPSSVQTGSQLSKTGMRCCILNVSSRRRTSAYGNSK